MREILFRGKALNNNSIWNVGYLISVKNKYYIHPETLTSERSNVALEKDMHSYSIWIYEVLPDTVGQYTALKDKNGNKIFEGDIVEYRNEKMLEHSVVGVVKFGEYNRTELPHQKDRQYGFFIDWAYFPILRKDIMCWINEGIEVIGNMYDNPELLESRNSNEQAS